MVAKPDPATKAMSGKQLTGRSSMDPLDCQVDLSQRSILPGDTPRKPLRLGAPRKGYRPLGDAPGAYVREP